MGDAEGALAHLPVQALAVLALVDRSPGVSVADAAHTLDLPRWRVRRAARRLRRRGLIEATGSGLRTTPAGAGLGAAGLIVRVLESIEHDGPMRFYGRRLQGVEPAQHTADSIARLLRGVDPGERLGVLLQLTGSESSAERAAAVRAIGLMRDPIVVPELLRLLGEPGDDRVRAAAAIGLGRSGDPMAAPALREVAATGSSLVRAAAAGGLGKLRDAAATSILADLGGYPSAPVRAAAALALALIGDQAATDALIALLADPDRTVRREAVDSVIALGTDRAATALAANPARGRLRRARDARRARTAQRNRARLDALPCPHVARLDAVTAADCLAWAAIAGAVVAIDAAILGVNAVVVALVVAALTVFGLRSTPHVIDGDDDDWTALVALDVARAQSRPLPAEASVTSLAASIARAFSAHTVVVIAIIAPAAVVIDLLTGRLGFGAGLLAGTLTMYVALRAVAARRAAAWQRERGVVFYTETARGPVPRRRYFRGER